MFETVSTLPVFESLDIVAGRWVLTLSNGARIDKGPAVASAPSLEAGAVTALAPGAAPSAEIRLVEGTRYAINLGIPAAGEGEPGVSPTLQVGNVTTLASGAQATAAVRAIGGHVYALDVGLPAGSAGTPGASPTLQVGNVTTLPAGSQATAAVRAVGSGAYAIDIGVPTGATGGAASIATLRRVYVGSVEIVSSNGSYNFAGVVPAGASEVEVECVGGGSSGFSGRYDTTNNVFFAGHGGYPGCVSRRRLRVADVPSPLAVTIGAGGADLTPQAAASRTNAGGLTSFGSLVQAVGGPAVSHVTLADLLDPGSVSMPSDVPLGQPGIAGTTTNAYGAVSPPAGNGNSATPSYGPGAGGAGSVDSNNGRGGDGGASGVGRPDTALRGGLVNGTSGERHGLSAASLFGYGSGGSGARVSFNGVPYSYGGGIGGAPGGAGGGGAGLTPSGDYNVSISRCGAGGRGAVRLHFYRYEAP